MQTERDDRQ